jgi:hypothetical protein
LDVKNVRLKIGDGYQGWPEHAPFQKIIVTCSPESIPEPLKKQLAEGGSLVIPLVFFDENRIPIDSEPILAPESTVGWATRSLDIRVPPNALFASLEVGLWGGTGILAIDDINIRVLE